MDDVWPAIETLIPTIGILGLFYLIMRHIMEGDRRERVAQAQWEREHDLAKGAVAPGETEARQQNAHLPKTVPGTMDSRVLGGEVVDDEAVIDTATENGVRPTENRAPAPNTSSV